MKTNLIFGAMLGLALPLNAQLLSNESITGAALGGLAGGVIGHNHHRQTAEGAAIGAGAGLLLGTLVHQERARQNQSIPAPETVYSPPSGPVYYTRETPYSRPSRAVGGAVLGGVIGGVVGHNHHRQTAEGVAIGAGAGLLLGHIADRASAQNRAAAATQSRAYYPGQNVVAVPEMPPMPPGADAYRVSRESTVAGTEEASGLTTSQPSIGRRPFGGSDTMQPANRLFGR